MSDIQFFAQGVEHFDLALKNEISAATSMAELQSLLNFNTTDAELDVRGLDRTDFNMRVGQSQLRSGKFFANMELPLTDELEFYAFGGLSYRNGNAGGFYRRPDQSRAYTGLYRAGFLPEINSDVKDKSAAFGIRGTQGEWDVDFSNTWGENSFGFNISNSVNATLLSGSPVEVNAGGFSAAENTTNIDLSRFYEDKYQGMNVAFGAEYRLENYQIFAGQDESWKTYDINGDEWNGDPSLHGAYAVSIIPYEVFSSTINFDFLIVDSVAEYNFQGAAENGLAATGGFFSPLTYNTVIEAVSIVKTGFGSSSTYVIENKL